MANFETFCRVISSSKNLLFLKSELDNPPHCTSFHASVAINSTTWITTGGTSDEKLQKKTYFYNKNERQFIAGPQLLTGRSAHVVGILHDKAVTNQKYLVVIGGRDYNNNILDSVEILKLDGANEWKTGIQSPYLHSGYDRYNIGIVIGRYIGIGRYIISIGFSIS